MHKFAIIFLLIFLPSLLFSTHASSLIFMLIRHGARTTGALEDAFKQIGYSAPKCLTRVGANQLQQLGSQIRKKHFSNRSPNDIHFSTSPASRCVHSMKNFTLGFHGTDKKTKNHEIYAKKFFHVFKIGQTPAEKKAIFDKKYHKKAAELLKLAQKYGFKKIHSNYCPTCVVDGPASEIIKTLKKLSTAIWCYRVNGVETVQVQANLLKILDYGFRLYYFKLNFSEKNEAVNYSKNVLKILGSNLLRNMRKKERIGKTGKKLKQLASTKFKVKKTNIMFAHDGNIIGLLRIIGRVKSMINKDVFRPPFAAHITVELVQGFQSHKEMNQYYLDSFVGKKTKLKGDKFVKIMYLNEEIAPKKCGYQTCTLSQFAKMVSRILEKRAKMN